MRIDEPRGPVHLTYCTNIHPGESWSEVRADLHHYLPAVKRKVAPGEPFGVGLRLAAAAAADLAASREQLEEFRDWLAANALYVFTFNGFPYGAFHGERVKQAVYRPDWRTQARLDYTNTLADLCAELLPAGLAGSISTVPGAFRRDAGGPADREAIARGLAEHVAHLVGLERQRGVTVRLAIEPEPCCVLETIAESVAFFSEHLFAGAGRAHLAKLAGLTPAAAEVALRRHLGVCLDLCHAAVEFEEPRECIAALRGAGIAIPKVQVSAGLRLRVDERSLAALAAFGDDVYLHQVVERRDGVLTRYLDLADARAAFKPATQPAEWRVHYHVPVFRAAMEELGTTRGFIEEVLALHREEPLSEQFEVETYTFTVLPEAWRNDDLVTHLVRELLWTIGELRRCAGERH